MKNSILILVLAVVVIIFGAGTFLFYQNTVKLDEMKKNDNAMSVDKAVTEDKDAMIEKDEVAIGDDKMTTSSYVEYSKKALDDSSNNKRVLFFYASWCPTCIPADANFKENISKIPQDVTLIRVNYNDPKTDEEEKELAKKYGITYQHTFVQIDGLGKEVAKWNGGQINELLANIK